MTDGDIAWNASAASHSWRVQWVYCVEVFKIIVGERSAGEYNLTV